MPENITPYKDSSLGKKEQVAKMFDTISGNYDGLNRVISFGIDVKWRKKVLQLVTKTNPKTILDIATGTGDLAILMSQTNADKIIGLDISSGMLEVGRKKIEAKKLTHKIELLLADSENMPFENNTFDAITVAFGVRNFENLEQGLSEILRVLRPGGKLVVLECSRPTLPVVKTLYNFYLNVITPLVGRLVSKNKNAYQYLNDSVQNFPERKTFVEILNKLGYKNASCKTLSLGICSIYCGEK